jgi:F-type H+-transporting ATPase subunit delta
MSEQRVAGRYAKSLIDLSKEQNILDIVKNDMLIFKQTLHQNIALLSMLKSPVVNGGDKIAVLKKIFEPTFHKLTIAFFNIVVRKNRALVLGSISEAFLEQYNDFNNIISASVKTAQPIDAATSAEVTQFIEKQSGKKVALAATVDPSLIGGLVIQVGDNLYDASIAGKLNKVKQNLLNTYISK